MPPALCSAALALAVALAAAPISLAAPAAPSSPGRGTSADSPEPGEEGIQRALALGLRQPAVAGPRGEEGQGPYRRLLIRNAVVVDGAGAPPVGPQSIEIAEDRIVYIGRERAGRAEGTDVRVLDAGGGYVLPGFIDAHFHLGTTSHGYAGALTDPEYVLKLQLAHGVTTVRDVGAIMGLEWTLAHRERAARGEISSPRLIVFAMFPQQHESVEAARRWVRAVREKGADGVKFTGAAPELLAAAIDEANRLGMRTAMHHAQIAVTRTDVLDSARMGLTSMEHWYGLPEAMFEDRRIQHYPLDYNYANEQHRFGEAGRLWQQTAAPGSERWAATIEELISLDFTLDPTFTIYEANRDLMRARNADWHAEYTMPYMARAFEADPEVHGSYFFDWTSAHEIDWKRNYRLWMTFINDYKNAGGRVTTGSDAGFIYKVYGFAYIRELELLQEAGFHPLEVLQAATINGAELLGIDDQTGSIQVGKKADLVVVDENPLANFKLLYGTGHRRLNRDSGAMERVGGVRYTIRDGIVFDAPALLAQVRALVAERRKLEAAERR